MRAESAAIWDGLHAHPFLREIAAGVLPLENFRFYLEQDQLYLVEYARCLALGAARSSDEPELRSFSVELSSVVDAELPGVRRLLARVVELGAPDRGGSIGMAPATLAYASYLQALAMRGTSLDIMAALLPCVWSYVEIARALAKAMPEHDVYAEWIALFVAEANVRLVGDMREAVDRLAARTAPDEGRFAEASAAFATSSRLERGFWDMAYRLERWPDLTDVRLQPPSRLP
jgi:thiaminase/transcriptional activator TenA